MAGMFSKRRKPTRMELAEEHVRAVLEPDAWGPDQLLPVGDEALRIGVLRAVHLAGLTVDPGPPVFSR